MNRDIQLFIDGHLVEWNGNPNIQFTYQTTDYTNPTVVKNNFSKTLNIDGTPENNKIFNEIWNLDRVMDGSYTLFNPSQKVPFELYRNDEIVEKGYVKLDSIDREGYKVGYNITLYGGLGSFFYSLDYDINSDKQKSLADLDFMGTNTPDDEFTFEINKNKVYDAWSRLGATGNTGEWEKWNYINFAPCYNGLPDNFDTSKVLLNTHNINGMSVRWTNDQGVQYSTFPQSINSNGTAFTPYNGYIYGELNKNLTEWETRDLRSYLQRPVLSIKGLFTAICRPQNNGGYIVDLDRDFFSSGNPYYEKAWVTLPLLDSAMETEGETEEFLWSGDTANKVVFNRGRVESYRIVPISNLSLVPNKIEFNAELHATFSAATADKLYTSIKYGNKGYYGGIIMQVYINKDMNLHIHPEATGGNPNPVCGSNRMIFTSRTLDGYYWQGMQYHTPTPYTDVATEWKIGYWKKVSGHDYVWTLEDGSTNIKFDIDTDNINLVPMICYWSQSVCNMSNMNNIYQYTGMAYSAQTAGSASDALSKGYVGLFTDHLEDNGSLLVTRGGDVTRSYTTINKRTIFGGLDVTPCDWLLGYCKLFGLHIYKDKNEDKIYIRMRNNFYGDEIVDIEDAIDRGESMKITPLTFDSKWYTLNYTESSGKFLDTYKKNYNQDFGKQLIDTRYNFDSEDVDLLEGIVYRNGLTALEKSNYFNNKYDIKQFQIPTVLYDWVKFKYYALEETYETNMALPQGCTVETINPYMDNEYYDVLPKLQIHDKDNKATDGEGILVFFNGKKNTGKVKYWITDDLDEMFRESDNPCWIATMEEWNTSWTERIAIGVQSLPEFSRYVVHYSNIPLEKGGRYQNITAAWDFGRTKELFVPYYRYDVDKTPTIYENFWQRYINDLYSVDTRKVDAYIKLDTNSVYDALKRFYWFDNCMWVMTKVENYDICLERNTLCSFTKVNDMASYLHDVTFDDYFFNFYRIDGSGNVPWSGTTDELTVNFAVDSSSDWYVMTGDYTIASMVNAYSTNAVSGTAGTSLLVQAVFTPNVGNDPRTVTFYGVNLETNQFIPITVTQDAWKHSSHLFLGTSIYYIPQNSTGMTFMVFVYSSDPWTCSYDVDWVHSSTNSGGAGDYTIWQFTCDPNYTGEERRTEVLFTNGTDTDSFIIDQYDKTKGSIEQNENDARYVVPSTGDTIHYEIVCDTDWRLVPSGSCSAYTSCADYSVDKQPTTGYTTGIYVMPNNSTVSRNIFFYLQYDGKVQKPTIVQLPLVQNGSGNTVINAKFDFSGDTITLNANDMPWTAYTYESWININPTSGASGETRMEYTLDENTGAYRVGYIYVEYTDSYGFPCTETFEIRQEGVEQFGISPTAITAQYTGGTFMLNVTASSPFTASTNDSWIVLPQNRPLGAIPFDVENNTEATARIGYINVTNGSETAQTQVLQYAETTNSPIAIKPSSIGFANTGGTGSLTIYCQGEWRLATDANWVTLNALSGNGNTIVSYSVSANSSLERFCVVSGYMSDYPQYSATTLVRQDANMFLYSDSVAYFPMTSTTIQIPVYSNVEWVAETEDSWLTISPSSGSGNGSISVTNESGSTPRNGSIVLSNDVYGLSFEITVIQENVNMIRFTWNQSSSPIDINVTTGWGANYIRSEYDTFVDGGGHTAYSATTAYFDGAITKIADYGLNIYFFINELFYPSSVTSIGECALLDLEISSLNPFVFNDNIEEIGSSAFTYSATPYLSSSTNFVNAFPNGLKTIGDYAFRGCYKLTGATIPSSVTAIGNYAFYNCTGMTSLDLSMASCSIGESAFRNTKITNIVIPSGVTLSTSSFENTSLTAVTVNTATIPNSCFNNNIRLAELTLGENVSSIGNYAFANSSMRNLYEIYAYPKICPTLGNNPFNNAYSTGTLHYPSGSDYSAMIAKLPSGWTAIGDL